MFTNFPRLWVIIITIVTQIIWFVWYWPLFGKLYQKENGFTEKDMQWWGMATLMVWEIIATFVLFCWLALLLQYVGIDHKREIGCIYFLGVLSTHWSTVIWWKGKTWKSWAMWAGKVLVSIIVALLLYGLW